VAGIVFAAAATAIVSSAGPASAEPSPAKKVQAVAANPSGKGVVKDSYIVVLKDSKARATEVTASAKALAQRFGGTVSHTYSSTIRGFAVTMGEAQAKQLAASPEVASVEPNGRVSASDTQINPPSWGLDRLEQIFAPLNKRYVYPNTASNVHAYIIDSGIRISHDEFGGRASYGHDFVDDDTVADDCSGHGTHVAGTVGGTNYGVAKAVQLVAVRVLGCDAAGTIADVIAGIDWVTSNAVKPAVANLSLGSDPSVTLDAAVEASIASGITYALSSGNDNADACNFSPGRTPSGITVGASDEVDFRTWFSNWGPCVDIHAPGHHIPSSFNTDDTAIAKLSGTSMAAPHVTGAAALALSTNPSLTPTQVRNFLVFGGTRRVVRNTAAVVGTPGRPATSDVMLRIGNNIVPFATGLRSLTNGRNVTVGPTGTQPLLAAMPLIQVGEPEKFTTAPTGGGFYSFGSWANGKFVSVTSGGTGPLLANASVVTDAEQFRPQMNGDGTVSLMSKLTGKWVTAPDSGASPLVATAETIGLAEKFIWASPAAVVALRANVNGKIVTTPNFGASPLIATATAVSYIERFDMLDLGDDAVVFRAHSDKKFVTATGFNGFGPLTANSTTMGPLQTFWLFHWGDGAMFFQSSFNGGIVDAPNGGASPLSATVDPSLPVLPTSVDFFHEVISVN
jgi:subtilisin family serine protease